MKRSKSNKTLLTILYLLLLIGLPLIGQDIKITATVNQNPVGVNDQFTYQVEISGSTQNLPDPQLPKLDDFRVVSGPNVSTSFQFINGAVSSSKTYTYSLLPSKTGTFKISPASVTYQENTYRSNPIELVVTKQRSASNQPNHNSQRQKQSGKQASSDVLFLRAVPSQRSVYVNEQITLKYKLYFRVTVRNPEFIKLPETTGFWVEEYPIPKDVPVIQEVLNGVQYNVAELKKFALFPTKAGKLSISSMRLAVDVIERRRRDPFNLDNFFDSPFGRSVRKVLTAAPVDIEVNPLPKDGKPANFSGLVGNFSLKTDLDKTAVSADEAVSLKLILSGDGNVKSLPDLSIEFPATFEVYDPKVKDNINHSGNQLQASKELEYVIIPRIPGEYTIKPVSISYFSPSLKKYKTLSTPEYHLSVGRSDKVAAKSNNAYFSSKSEVKLLGKDIHFIKEEGLNLHPIGHRPYQDSWFWAALILPALFFVGAYGYRHHMEKMSTNVEYARRRKAFKQASQRLKGAHQFLKQNKFAEFYGEVSRGLIGFVADKTNQSAAGLMRDDVELLLKHHNVPEGLIIEYLKYLDEADFRRFAPGQIAANEAHTFYKDAEQILVKLGKYL